MARTARVPTPSPADIAARMARIEDDQFENDAALDDTPLEHDGLVSRDEDITSTPDGQTKTKWLRVVIKGSARGCMTGAISARVMQDLLASQFQLQLPKREKYDNVHQAMYDKAYVCRLALPKRVDSTYRPYHNFTQHVYGIKARAFLKAMQSARKVSKITMKGLNDEVVEAMIQVHGAYDGVLPFLASPPPDLTADVIDAGGLRGVEEDFAARAVPKPFLHAIAKNASGKSYQKGSGGATVNVAPLFRDWYAELYIGYEAGSILNRQIVLQLLEAAGKDVGVGSNRPHKFGRFRVVSTSFVELPESFSPGEYEVTPENSSNIIHDPDTLLPRGLTSRQDDPAEPVPTAPKKRGRKPAAAE